MYQEHFKLKQQPFLEHAAVNSLWIDQRMKEALARLTFLVDHANFGLITGPSGAGKSALLKCFFNNLPQRCEAVYCHLTHLPSAGMLKALVTQMGEVPRRGKERLFEQSFQAASEQKVDSCGRDSGATQNTGVVKSKRMVWLISRKIWECQAKQMVVFN